VSIVTMTDERLVGDSTIIVTMETGAVEAASGVVDRIRLSILPQPDDQTCGPTCLHAVYGYYGLKLPLSKVVAEISQLEGGGTVAVTLGNHALRNGFHATIFTYNLQVFDPSWFASEVDLIEKLRSQARHKTSRKLRRITHEYLEFLEKGGKIRFEDLTESLIEGILSSGHPILTGLSATYLYSCARELGADYDDVRGEPMGHFVVLSSYDARTRRVWIADPLHPNPMAVPSQQYEIDVRRVISSILLGTLTYDANLLLIEPREGL